MAKKTNPKNKASIETTDLSESDLKIDEVKIDPHIIDSRDKIANVDKSDVLGSIEALADQVRQAWEDTQKINFSTIHEVKNIVIAGMGGSGLGGRVVKHLFKQQLKVPLEVVNDYSLPKYINQDSLVILSSYSGNTEEILACAQQAKAAAAQIAVITAGGELQKIAKDHQYPAYIIEPKYNPSEQPRMAIGYAVIGLIGLLNQAEIISVSQQEIDQVVETIIHTMHDCRVEAETEKNPAKMLTFQLVDRRPNFIGAEFITGALHVSRNQFHENAKTFAEYYQIPEINHHLLESLELPISNVLDNIFLFFSSELYHERNQLRMALTQEAVEKQNIQTLEIKLTAPTALAQVFEVITLLAFVNFYLAMLHQIDPSQIKMVNWFKQKLE